MLVMLFSCTEAVKAGTESVWIECNVLVRNEDSREWIEDIPVVVYCDGKKVQTILTARDGKAYLSMESGKVYDIQVNGMSSGNRMISKLIRFDTRDIDFGKWKYRESKSMKYHYDFEILLFQSEACENYDFLKSNPIIHFVYSPDRKDLIDIADQSLSKQIKAERKKKCQTQTAVF
jgi:hypothetical protein